MGKQPDHRAQLQARLGALKLDRTVQHPRDEHGRIACGDRLDCYILAVEGCEPASLDYTQSVSGYGLRQTVSARYEVHGQHDGHCRLSRQRKSFAVALEPGIADKFASQGKTPEQIEDFRLDAENMLGTRNPLRLRCDLSPLAALETALDLTEGRHRPSHWRGRCIEPLSDAELAEHPKLP